MRWQIMMQDKKKKKGFIVFGDCFHQYNGKPLAIITLFMLPGA